MKLTWNGLAAAVSQQMISHRPGIGLVLAQCAPAYVAADRTASCTSCYTRRTGTALPRPPYWWSSSSTCRWFRSWPESPGRFPPLSHFRNLRVCLWPAPVGSPDFSEKSGPRRWFPLTPLPAVALWVRRRVGTWRHSLVECWTWCPPQCTCNGFHWRCFLAQRPLTYSLDPGAPDEEDDVVHLVDMLSLPLCLHRTSDTSQNPFGSALFLASSLLPPVSAVTHRKLTLGWRHPQAWKWSASFRGVSALPAERKSLDRWNKRMVSLQYVCACVQLVWAYQ